MFETYHTTTVILTATARLANYLQREYQKNAIQMGKMVFESAPIYALNTWLQNQWQMAQNQLQTEPHVLLSDFEHLCLWQKMISHAMQDWEVLGTNQIAELAQTAERLLLLWDLDYRHLPTDQVEHSLFLNAQREIRHFYQDNHLLTSAHLLPTVLELIANRKLPLSPHYCFAGFDEMPPMLMKLWHYLENGGARCDIYHPPQQASRAHQVGFIEPITEIESLAYYFKRQQDQYPEQSIACIVPNLRQSRPAILQQLTKALLPSKSFSSAHPLQGIINISAGATLTEFPLIQTALQLLELALETEVPLAIVDALLHSPFIVGADAEFSNRSNLSAVLHEIGNTSWSRAELTRLAGLKKYRHYACYSPIWDRCLQNLPRVGNAPQSIDEIVRLFQEILDLFGWPGDRTLNSEEFQIWSRWQITLQEFKKLATVHRTLSAKKARVCLQDYANRSEFQFKDPPTNIMVLGTLEATGLCFDKAWLLSMDEITWPPFSHPHPLLSKSLQRQHNMPHSSAEREYQFGKQVTKRLLSIAPDIIVSFAQSDPDRETKISDLFTHLPKLNADEFIAPAATLATDQFEYFQDDYGPAIDLEKPTTGGSRIFTLQAACPFRAFAEIRLGAQTIQSTYDGLDAKERGSLTHKILEQFWQQTETHANLCTLELSDLKQLVQYLSHHALVQFRKKSARRLSWAIIELEQERLTDLIVQWLLLEKSRTPFEVIKTEQREIVSLDDLQIRLTIDRLDQLQDGSMVIIDYKTGQPSLSAWFGDRPEDPQLPLYYLTSQIPISGLVFAQIRPEEILFRGILSHREAIPNTVEPSHFTDKSISDSTICWAVLRKQWQQAIFSLSHQFKQGFAGVDPKTPATCQYCQCHALCRIYDQNNLY